MKRVFYKVHINSSTGEEDILAEVVEKLDHGFFRIREKGTKRTFVVYKHKLGQLANEERKDNE